MCDQIVAVISSEHSQSLIWNEADDDDDDIRDESDGRIIKCVVDETTEQEESVQVREGFKVCAPISLPIKTAKVVSRFNPNTFPFEKLLQIKLIELR